MEIRNKATNAVIAKYEYDSDGRRVKSTVNGVITNFHYDGDGIRVLYKTNGSNQLTTLYTYTDSGALLNMTKVGQGTYYYHYNAHGDVMQLTDDAGNIVASYIYDAWGNIVSKSGSMADSNPYRYAGYRYDNETGYYYLMLVTTIRRTGTSFLETLIQETWTTHLAKMHTPMGKTTQSWPSTLMENGSGW